MTDPRPDAMRALTVRQPFAWAIAHRGKRVENRSRRFHYKGPLAIHAGSMFGKSERDAIPFVADRSRVPYVTVGEGSRVRGVIVAVARIDGLCSTSRQSSEIVCECGPWAQPGHHHLILTDVRPLDKPVPCKGMLGLWRLPEDVEAAVMAQLGEAASRD